VGRTNPTFRDTLRAIEDRWSDYRRGLRRDDQPRFDALFEYATAHADASSYLNHETPMEALLFSVALEQEARLDDLESRLETLEANRE
jgi:hypothetical protein